MDNQIKRTAFVLIASLLMLTVYIMPAKAQENIQWYSLEKAQKLSKQHHKKVLIYAKASWCGYCKKMDRKVFTDKSVVKTMSRYYYPVRIDIESGKKMKFNGKEMTQQQFSAANRVQGTPTTFFINEEGRILGTQPGYIPVDTFKKLLAYVGSGAFQKVKFKDYSLN